jgi:hypothetical protein
VDPFALDRAIEATTATYDAQYIDIIEPMSRLSQPAQMYYSVNGHPNGKGKRRHRSSCQFRASEECGV